MPVICLCACLCVQARVTQASYIAFQGGTKLFQNSSPIPTRLELRWNFGTAYIDSNLLELHSNIIPTWKTKLEPWITFKYLMKSSTYERQIVDNLWIFQNSSFFSGQRVLRCFLVRSSRPASVSIMLNKPYIAYYLSKNITVPDQAYMLEFWNNGIM